MVKIFSGLIKFESKSSGCRNKKPDNNSVKVE